MITMAELVMTATPNTLVFIGPTVAFFSPKQKEVEPPVDSGSDSPATPTESPVSPTVIVSSVKLNPAQLASTPVATTRILSVSSGELAATGSNSQLLVVLGLSLVLISASSVILIKLTKLN